jgi:ornithine carbamoyltransferase
MNCSGNRYEQEVKRQSPEVAGDSHEAACARNCVSRRIKALIPYRVTSKIMAASGNPHAKFMHCLPAFHNSATEVGADIQKRFGIDCMEVAEEVFESPASIVFDQAENRMHTIKAILVATIAG